MTRCLSRPAPHFPNSWKWWVGLAFLLLVSVAIPSRGAVAGSRSSLVFVSVQVVASCRVDAVGSPTGNSVDVQTRCNSKARPSIGLEGQSTTTQLSTTVTGAQAISTISLAPTGGDGQMLRIDF